MTGDTGLLEIRALTCSYDGSRRRTPGRRRTEVAVVRDVSFVIPEGATVALVGESGSGKTTIARVVAGLLAPRAGQVNFRGKALPQTVARRSRDQRREIQYVFQNPDASLNPRHRVREVLGRPLKVYLGLPDRDRKRRVAELLEDVQLDPGYASLFPTELSGGERQRVAIARALAAEPGLLLCDEILTALDVSVQKRILDLLRKLRREHGLTLLFISHDLGAVRSFADHVVVLCQGEVVEVGPPDRLFANPQHPYCKLLIDSIPKIGTPLDVADTGHHGGENLGRGYG